MHLDDYSPEELDALRQIGRPFLSLEELNASLQSPESVALDYRPFARRTPSQREAARVAQAKKKQQRQNKRKNRR